MERHSTSCPDRSGWSRRNHAELVIGRKDGSGFVEPPEYIPLVPAGQDADGVLTFSVSHTIRHSGAYAYGIRVLPFHPHLAAKQETGLIYWG